MSKRGGRCRLDSDAWHHLSHSYSAAELESHTSYITSAAQTVSGQLSGKFAPQTTLLSRRRNKKRDHNLKSITRTISEPTRWGHCHLLHLSSKVAHDGTG